MLGAIIGDIIGSVYEWHNVKTADFELFTRNSKFTDDTVMTVAVADALLNREAGVETLFSGIRNKESFAYKFKEVHIC
jgi:ADP-ribosylglycohydrolase